MWGWLREFREIWNEPKPCSSCEVLKIELSRERAEKERLLSHVLTPQSKEPERAEAPELQVPISQRQMPWKVRQQLLEAEDRQKARVIAEFQKRNAAAKVPNPITPATTIEELEQNLGVVKEK